MLTEADATDCPVCGCAKPGPVETETLDFLFSREKFSVVRCPECGLLRTHPLVPENEIGRFYFESYAPYVNGLPALPFLTRLKSLWRRHHPDGESETILRLLKLLNARTVLEVGTGAGRLTRILASHGYTMTGIEFNAACADSLNGTGIECYPGTLESGSRALRGRVFDVIILRHVFEHLYNPLGSLRLLNSFLRKNGTLLLSLPNAGSWEATFFGRYWIGWDVPRHVFHYAPRPMRLMLEKAGFREIQISADPFSTSLIESLELSLFDRPAPAWFHLPLYYSWRVLLPVTCLLGLGSGSMKVVART